MIVYGAAVTVAAVERVLDPARLAANRATWMSGGADAVAARWAGGPPALPSSVLRVFVPAPELARSCSRAGGPPALRRRVVIGPDAPIPDILDCGGATPIPNIADDGGCGVHGSWLCEEFARLGISVRPAHARACSGHARAVHGMKTHTRSVLQIHVVETPRPGVCSLCYMSPARCCAA